MPHPRPGGSASGTSSDTPLGGRWSVGVSTGEAKGNDDIEITSPVFAFTHDSTRDEYAQFFATDNFTWSTTGNTESKGATNTPLLRYGSMLTDGGSFAGEQAAATPSPNNTAGTPHLNNLRANIPLNLPPPDLSPGGAPQADSLGMGAGTSPRQTTSKIGSVTARGDGQIVLDVPCVEATHRFLYAHGTWNAQQACDQSGCRNTRKGLRNLRSIADPLDRATWIAAQVLTLTEVRRWRRTAPRDVLSWRTAGFHTLKAVVLWQWCPPETAASWMTHEFLSFDAKAWDAAGFTVDDALPWNRNGIRSNIYKALPDDYKDFEVITAWADTAKLSLTVSATWLITGIDDPRTVKKWRSQGFTPHHAREWREAGFDSPSMARRWSDAAYYRPELARSFVNAGCINPDSAAAWLRFGEDHHHRQESASQAAVRWAASGVEPSRAIEWFALGVTTPETIAGWESSNVTPAEVDLMAHEGSLTLPVCCGGSSHTVSVTWSNYRNVRWAAHDHDERSERAATAFGAEPPPCIKVVKAAKGWKHPAGPGERLRWASRHADDPLGPERTAVIHAEQGYPLFQG